MSNLRLSYLQKVGDICTGHPPPPPTQKVGGGYIPHPPGIYASGDNSGSNAASITVVCALIKNDNDIG